ncbi:MAG: histidinol-phosphatase HisJ family protein [Lentisphaerae bacterium]|nr:histidinol-phosphatase HisJ family protein [Lentisphaerota bacterium]
MKFTFPGPGCGYSLHNHSVFSDGADSLEDMVIAGKKSHVKVLGISDHWAEVPYDNTDYREWTMDHGRLNEYVDSLLQLKQKYEDDDFQLKLGLEVDFFFENIAQVAARLKEYPFDYLIGSVHYCGVFSVDHAREDWLPLSEEEKAAICQQYYQKLQGAAECGVFTFLGHLDLPKKFGMIDNSLYYDHAVKILDAVQKHSGAIELNTSGWFKPCAEPYPGADILQEALRRKIPIVVSADAHCAEHLQRNFAEAYELLHQLPVTQ